jgi:PadR family transcriptional regulator, regulatory protein AphA
MRSNRSQYAVLGLLAGGPRTGYEIAKEISTVLSHFWSESDGQIYPVLHGLARAGLADVEEEPGAPGRRRRRYHITGDGREALADWLGQAVQPLPPRHELLLKLFFGRHARHGELAAVIRAYRERAIHAARRLSSLASAVQSEHGEESDLAFWLLSIDFGRASLESTIRWCDRALDTINGMEGYE